MNQDKASIPLATLVVPILVENLIRTSLMAVDQLMLYAYSEKSAAAMSAVNQFGFFIQLLYMLVASGASILISQNLGAGKRAEAGRIALGSHLLIGLFALVLSVVVAIAAAPVLGLFALEPEVERYAVTFLAIYGGASAFMALNIVQANVLRAYGHARDPMVINAIALAVTVAGNALCLFGPFGLPVYGIAGVAWSTVLGQFVAFAIGFFRIRGRAEIELRWREAPTLPGSVYRGILAVGVPTAGEILSYNVAQIFIVAFIARLGTASLAAYGLVITLCRYVFIGGVSIGAGTQLKVGYLVGAGRHDEAYRKVYRYWAVGIAVSAGLILALNLVKAPVLALFTKDPEITAIASLVLLVGLVLEPGRNFNTVIIPALKGSGDVLFPVLAGVFSTWGLGVAGGYFLGVKLGFGLAGIWVGMCLDEWSRGVVMMLRWKSGAWQAKTLVRG